MSIEVRLPDLGGSQDVAVLELLVKPGEHIEVDTPLLTLESEKATMDVPSSAAGVLREWRVAVGAKVASGDVIAVLDAVADAVGKDQAEAAPKGGSDSKATADADSKSGASANGDVLRAKEPYGGEPYVDTVPIPPQQLAAALESPPAGAREGAPTATATAPAAARDFDVVVLGAGPGGYTAAFRAADLGLKVGLVERWPTLGGVCLNVGCIPSKALLHAARVIDEAEAMAAHGLRFGAPQIDAGKLCEWKNAVVGRLTGGLTALAKQRKVTVLHGEGRFAGAHELEISGKDSTRRVSFAHCIVAAGSESMRLPGFPEDPRIIDSAGALELDLPGRLLVVGGGIIGLEMATVYAALGVKVTVVELTDGLMPGCDRDLVRPLEKRLATRLEAVYTGTRVVRAEARNDGIHVEFEGKSVPGSQRYDKLLLAVGRAPNGKRINAEAAGLEVDAKGFIAVDRQMRTKVPHIFAIGDIVGQPMLAHKATHEGKVAAEVIAGQKSAFDARVIPSVAYTDPEIAWVGLTETEAAARGIAFEKAVFPWAASGRSLAIGRDEGSTKLLFDPQTHRVVGGGIVGTNAGDLISEVGLAIEMGADAADIGLTVHPHPTLSETVAMAAESFEGTLTDLYVPKKRKGARAAG